MKQIIAIITLAAFMFACGGKKEEQKVEEVKEQVEETVNEISDNVEEAVEEVEEKTEEIKNEVNETSKNVVKKTEELASGVKKVMQGKGEWSGNVILLSDLVTSSAKNLTKEEAVNYVKSKKMIAFMSEGNTYLVFNTDGSYASKALAIALEDGVVKIKGKVNSVGGMNTIIADVIE